MKKLTLILKINSKLIFKYFNKFNDPKSEEFQKFETYLLNFYKFCFELSLKNMVKDVLKFNK